MPLSKSNHDLPSGAPSPLVKEEHIEYETVQLNAMADAVRYMSTLQPPPEEFAALYRHFLKELPYTMHQRSEFWAERAGYSEAADAAVAGAEVLHVAPLEVKTEMTEIAEMLRNRDPRHFGHGDDQTPRSREVVARVDRFLAGR